VFTSQFLTDLWFENLPDPSPADAILDRILHNAYRLELAGESLWKLGNDQFDDLQNARHHLYLDRLHASELKPIPVFTQINALNMG
jgi:hypothetical protein